MNKDAHDPEEIHSFQMEVDHDLTPEEIRAEFEKAIREGKVPGFDKVDMEKLSVELSPAPLDAYFTSDFAKEFWEEILQCDWPPVYVSEDSDCTHFGATREEVVQRIEEYYGVDVSHLPNMNIWKVMKNVEDAD